MIIMNARKDFPLAPVLSGVAAAFFCVLAQVGGRLAPSSVTIAAFYGTLSLALIIVLLSFVLLVERQASVYLIPATVATVAAIKMLLLVS